jgi:hypothetical protein
MAGAADPQRTQKESSAEHAEKRRKRDETSTDPSDGIDHTDSRNLDLCLRGVWMPYSAFFCVFCG